MMKEKLIVFWYQENWVLNSKNDMARISAKFNIAFFYSLTHADVTTSQPTIDLRNEVLMMMMMISFIEQLSCTLLSTLHVLTYLFSPQPYEIAAIIILISWMSKVWGSERLSNLLKLAQLVSGRAVLLTQ